MFVIEIKKEDINKLRDLFSPFLVSSLNPYIAFRAVTGSVEIESYTSGKVVLKGEDAMKVIKSLDIPYNITKSNKTNEHYSAIGSDEVGTGDLFGPVVICSFFVEDKDIDYFQKLGIMDSKSITDSRIIELGDILKKYTYNIVLISNKKYNELISLGYNMNSIKAIAHNKGILCTINDIKKTVPVILDQFCEPRLYFDYLKNVRIVYDDIVFKTKAESFHIAVACASIMARYIFLKEMDRLSKELNVTLLKGAGEKVDEQLKTLINKDLTNYAKLNFKNFKKIEY